MYWTELTLLLLPQCWDARHVWPQVMKLSFWLGAFPSTTSRVVRPLATVKGIGTAEVTTLILQDLSLTGCLEWERENELWVELYKLFFFCPHAVTLSRILRYLLISRDNKQELASLYLLFLILIFIVSIYIHVRLEVSLFLRSCPPFFSFWNILICNLTSRKRHDNSNLLYSIAFLACL